MKARLILAGLCVAAIAFFAGCGPMDSIAINKYYWAVHDMTRPQPVIVWPGKQYGDVPSDATVLFDGEDLSEWVNRKGQEAHWKVEDGYMVASKGGPIITKSSFGSCQLHVEWAAPSAVEGTGQKRGNSGIYLMNNYEVQILDSFDNVTYSDGHAAAIYGQYPPLVNASRRPSEWQNYDIIFHRPKFDKKGKLILPARITVIHNGVVVQDNIALKGATAHKKEARYKAHADRLPIRLQYHGDAVRFRNIWIRELPQRQ